VAVCSSCAMTLLLTMPTIASGQIFVANGNTGSIGEYNFDGSTINAKLITGLSDPGAITIANGFLYVTNYNNNTVGEYTTAGATINAALVTGLDGPVAVAVLGNVLFVVNNLSNSIGEYNATTGATINASFITGLNYPVGIALSGTNLFVSNRYANSIGEYDATTGATINAALITGLNNPCPITIAGENLYVANDPLANGGSTNLGPIGVYNLNTGVAVNASLIPVFEQTASLAVFGSNLYASSVNLGIVAEFNSNSGATANGSFLSGLGAGTTGIAVIPPVEQITINFTANIDGLSDILISPSGFQWEHFQAQAPGLQGGNFPTLVSIENGNSMVLNSNWFPNWTGQTVLAAGATPIYSSSLSTSSTETQFYVPGSANLSVLQSRGSTSMLETPSATNGNVFRIEFNDISFSGSTNYQFSLTYSVMATPPVISNQPVVEAVVTGNSAIFSVSTISPLPQTYQWQVSTDGGNTWNNVSGTSYTGSTTAVLTIANPTTEIMGYQYQVIINNAVGSSVSFPAPLVIGSSNAKLAWLQTYFTTAQLGNPGLISDTATPANDGIPNLMKYAFNLNPLTDDNLDLPQPAISNGQLTLTFPTLQTDLIYTVQASTDLINWSTSGVTVQANGSQMSASYSLSGNTPVFLRIFVSETP